MVTLDFHIDVTEEAITSALDAIRRGSFVNYDNQILFLYSVTSALKTKFAGDEACRPIALTQLLSSHLLSVINSMLRQYSDIQLHDASEIDVVISVLDDIPMNSSELLLGTLWIYIHYFRFDFDIGRDDFCNRFAIGKRTLQRYQSSAIQRLTVVIIQAEAVTRKNLKRSKLPVHVHLSEAFVDIGIYAELAQDIVNVFRHPHSSKKRIVMFGPPFSGKTFLASQVAHQLIDENVYDDIVWINAPESVREVVDILDDMIHEVGDRLFVVVDNAEKLLSSYQTDLCKFVDQYSFVSILLSTTKRPQEVFQQMFRLLLIKSSVLMKQYRRNCIQASIQLPPSYCEQLANVSMNYSTLYQPPNSPRQSLSDLVISLEIECLVVLTVISLMRDGNCSEAELKEILPTQIMDRITSILQLLQDYGLIYVGEELPGHEVYFTTSQIRMIIIRNLEDKSPLVFHALELVTSYLLDASKVSQLNMIEAILLKNICSSAARDNLIEVGIPLGVLNCHWLEWSLILERVLDKNKKCQIAYLLCCIGIGKVSKARRLTKMFIADMGRRGVFEGDFECLRFLLNETAPLLTVDADAELRHAKTPTYCNITMTTVDVDHGHHTYSYFENTRSRLVRSYDQQCLIAVEHNQRRKQ